MNPILDSDAEKWILIDGRDIHTLNDFYEQIESKLTNKTGFNLHIVWIYAKKNRQELAEKTRKFLLASNPS